MTIEGTKTFDQFVQAVAKIYKNRTAIKIRPRFRTISWNYDDLFKHSVLVAQLLEKKKIKRGDRVLLWTYNSPLWVASFFGIQLKGAVAVPINVQNTPDFIKKIIKQTQAKLIIKSNRLPAIRNVKTISIENIHLPPNFIAEFKKTKIKENELAEIIYTSGTTGFPKGVMLTHKNILSNVKASLEAIPVSRNDRFLSILPLSHMFEQVGGMLVPLSMGAQITYATVLNSISVRKNLVDDKITKMLAVPEFLKLLVKRIEAEAEKEGKKELLDSLINSSLKIPLMPVRRLIFRRIIKRFGGHLHTIASGGAALDAEIGKKIEAFGIYVLQGYGTTEASPVISVNRYSDRKVDSVGKPLAGVHVKIAEDGEILVKGDNVTHGYFKNPQKTKESFVDGQYKTDDIGYFDEDGHLYVKGRKKYVIITEAGENVYPEDIEFELNKIPGVEDSAVVGFRKDGKLEIHAVLLGKEIRNPEEIISEANSKLTHYQHIQGYTIWPFNDFPRTVTKKVKKNEVLDYLEKIYVGKEVVPVEIKKDHEIYRVLSQISGFASSEITDDKKLGIDLKLDSLARVELVSLIEEELGVVLDEAEIRSETSVGELKNKIEGNVQKVEKYELKEWALSAFARVVRGFLQAILVNPWLYYYAPLKIEGIENLRDLELPAIFFANHIGGLDAPIVVRALPSKIENKLAIAAAIDTFWEHPKFKKYANFITLLYNAYPFAREKTEKPQIKSSLEYTGRLIDRGFSILAFPEGQMSVTGQLQSLKEGAGFLAVEMQVPVVPIKLTGSELVYSPFKKTGELPDKHEVIVKIGKPMKFSSTDSYIEVTKEIENALQNL